MANQILDTVHAKEKRVVKLFAAVTIGNTGAPTLVASKSKGIKSITRTSAGLYVLTLNSAYVKFINAHFRVILATGFPAAPYMHVVSTTIGTANPGVLTFQCGGPTAAGDTTIAATDPASGEELRITIEVGDSGAF